jgi:hypothetical protein
MKPKLQLRGDLHSVIDISNKSISHFNTDMIVLVYIYS